MSLEFPKNPGFSGFNAPFRMNIDLHDAEFEGEIPVELNGHFYRIQPDFIYPPRFANDVPFNGDGNVTLFKFANGRVDVKTHHVETQRYKAQKEARQALFGTYRNPRTDMDAVKGLSGGTANTNLIFHGGKLFALKEDSPPVQVDPFTLKGIDDYYTFDGKMTAKTFTAHPKIDPINGEMIAIAYEAKGEASKDVALYAIDKNGNVCWEAWIEVPYAGMIHDFAITETHIAILVVPMAVNVEQMEQGGVHFAWDSSLPSYFGVVARNGDGSDLRWYEGPEKCATHVMNGYNEGSKIIVDMDMATGNQFPFFPSLHEQFDLQRASGKLTRITIDLADTEATTYQTEVLYPQIGVLPRTDERYWSRPYNVGFMPCMDPTKPRSPSMAGNVGMTLNTWVRFDHDKKSSQTYFPGENYTLQECQFVPKSDDAPEGCGYLMGIANNFDTMLSELHILDAENIEAGTIAKVKLPVRLRQGVHGHWVSSHQLS